MASISLEYGTSGCWRGVVSEAQLLWQFRGPDALPDPAAVIAEALNNPLDFPALRQALVPDDKVTVVLDRDIPSAAELIAGIWTVCQGAGIAPENFTILQPISLTSLRPDDPRRLLSESVRRAMTWKIHDPSDTDGIGYLASSSDGERIYLSRDVLNADFVLPIGRLGFDPVQGRRSAMSSFYPGLSNTEAFAKSRGQGHSELGPDDERPIGQRIQEIGWLVGVQFSVLVMPSSGHGGAAAVLAGQPDSVAQQGRGLLDDNWRIKVDQRGETAIVSIPAGADNPTGWDQLGDALQAASRLVVREGRIIVLSDLAAEPGPGIGILRSCRSARAALQPLRKESPPDLVPASQIAAAADWASVYLLSKLAPSLVEELFMTPLESEAEVTRLIESCDGCIIVTGAQHVYSEILE
ncbi:MAG: lactate racemase domain-containing protein [Planctomycetaceae bacterium]